LGAQERNRLIERHANAWQIVTLARWITLAQTFAMAIEGSSRKRWSEEETVLALYLYFQLPFGKLHSGNPEIQELAAALGCDEAVQFRQP
jgi:hypothetical protein